MIIPFTCEIIEIVMLCCSLGCAIGFFKSAVFNKQYSHRNMRIIWGCINLVMTIVWGSDILFNGTTDFWIIITTMIAMFYVDYLYSEKWLKND